MRRLLVLSLFLLAPLVAQAQSAAPRKFVVFFELWSANIDDSAKSVIAAAAEAAKQDADARVLVTGFADPAGGTQANLYLSLTRAQVVLDGLAQDGGKPERLRLSARGETEFTLSAQESRRVEISVGGR